MSKPIMTLREIMDAEQPNGEAAHSIAWLNRPFALFTGATYYPAPGWQGYYGQYATLEEASAIGKELAYGEYKWWQVVDLRELKIVAGEGAGHTGLSGLCPAI